MTKLEHQITTNENLISDLELSSSLDSFEKTEECINIDGHTSDSN